MFVVAASFVGLVALIPYLVIWGPADPEGLEAAFELGTMRIRAVAPNVPLAEAGLQGGDQVLSVGGRPVRNLNDWAAVLYNLEVGRLQVWTVLRDGRQLEIKTTTARATRQNRLAFGYISICGLAISCFALGVFIAFRRPNDLVARIGAWFITTASIGFGLPNGWAVPWRQLPAAAAAFLWIPEISRFVIEGIFVTFFAVFPCRLFRSRWPWVLIWAPVLATLPWRISSFASVIYHPEQPSTIPPWFSQVANLRAMIYLVVGVVMLLVSYRKLADRSAKRRVRVLMWGTAISLLTAIPLVWIFFAFGYALKPRQTFFVFFTLPGILACPLAFAYAILRHRVLDIHVIIRMGLQYALARGAVIGVLPFAGVIFALDLAVNRQEPLAYILQARGWGYASLGGLAFLAYWRRKPWLEALDRRFFREHYNAQKLLRDVVEEIREARNLERVSPQVVARIESALHPEFVSLMVHEAGEASYRVLASVPAGQPAPILTADSKLVALARLLGKPLMTLSADSGWLDRRLPREEIEMVRRARIDLLVPIPSTAGSSEAILALGAKLSEEPYTQEDQELLETLASSLAILVDSPSLAVQHPTGTFEECPECGVCCDSGSGKCTLDGTHLTPVPLPRVLAGRYRLERRRGRGGMGTVYEATDKTLDRNVAVKVIREDWLNSADATPRFHREARAAAAFSHPNVVTVHDYGVEAGTRAFLVMELLKGVSLREELRNHKRLTAPRTAEIFRGLCSAVDAAHRRHLIHRDLKPENVFLAQSSDTGSEIVKILDFGIAKALPLADESAETQTMPETGAGILVGTAGYMSPEQLLGERPGTAWDLWALAVVAYECLTGVLPFTMATRNEWRQAVLAGRHTPMREHLPDAPAAWQEFFACSFATERARRPASASEFFRDLEKALAGPVKAPAHR
jgi:eukaryotic-like serine/threonine-protein kinase